MDSDRVVSYNKVIPSVFQGSRVKNSQSSAFAFGKSNTLYISTNKVFSCLRVTTGCSLFFPNHFIFIIQDAGLIIVIIIIIEPL